jgi:ADP-heptose:LPS heptosyltransferase
MRVLLAAGGGIGNVIMATPAVAALARLGFDVTVYLQPETAAAAGLLEGWPELSGVLTEPPPDPSGFDLAVHTAWSRRRGLHPEERAPGEIDLRTMHEAEADLLPARALGYAGPLPPAHVECDESGVSLEPGSYCVLAPGCNPDAFWERKRWSGWDELAGLLPGRSVFLGTASESRPWMDRGPHRIDLTGRTLLRQAAGWIAHSRGFVGIDNGLAHVAAALGVPTVALFGATSETKNRPLGPRVRVLTRDLDCRPCQMTPRWHECAEWRCMRFDPEQVAGAAFDLAGG